MKSSDATRRAKVLLGGDYSPVWWQNVPRAGRLRAARALLGDRRVRGFLGGSLRRIPLPRWKSELATLLNAGAVLGELGTCFADADLVTVNLECVLDRCGSPLPGKKYHLLASRLAALPLLHHGIGPVALANNHTQDFGAASAAATAEIIDRLGIGALGLWRDAEQPRQTPLIREVNGLRLGFLAYVDRDTTDPSAAEYFRGYPQPFQLDLETVVADLTAARDQADHWLVHLHWGNEWSHVVTDGQRELARQLIDAGVTVVIGHHPHVVQDYERYRHGAIFYSLGNLFMSLPGVMRTRCQFGLVAALDLSSQGLEHIDVKTVELPEVDRPFVSEAVTFEQWLGGTDAVVVAPDGAGFRLSRTLAGCQAMLRVGSNWSVMNPREQAMLDRIPLADGYTSADGTVVACGREFFGRDLRAAVLVSMARRGSVRVTSSPPQTAALRGYVGQPNWFSANRSAVTGRVTLTRGSDTIVSWRPGEPLREFNLDVTAGTDDLVWEITSASDGEMTVGFDLASTRQAELSA